MLSRVDPRYLDSSLSPARKSSISWRTGCLRYGHLMPGNEDEAAGLLDARLKRATGAAGA